MRQLAECVPSGCSSNSLVRAESRSPFLPPSLQSLLREFLPRQEDSYRTTRPSPTRPACSRSTKSAITAGSISITKSTAASAATISARSAEGVTLRRDSLFRSFSARRQPPRSSEEFLASLCTATTKHIAKRACLLEQSNMAGMKQIEHAVHKHHARSVALPIEMRRQLLHSRIRCGPRGYLFLRRCLRKLKPEGVSVVYINRCVLLHI